MIIGTGESGCHHIIVCWASKKHVRITQRHAFVPPAPPPPYEPFRDAPSFMAKLCALDGNNEGTAGFGKETRHIID